MASALELVAGRSSSVVMLRPVAATAAAMPSRCPMRVLVVGGRDEFSSSRRGAALRAHREESAGGVLVDSKTNGAHHDFDENDEEAQRVRDAAVQVFAEMGLAVTLPSASTIALSGT